MKLKKFLILVATLAVVGTAVMLTHRNAPTTDITSAPFYPGLLDRLNDVARLEIKSKDQATVLRKAGESWVVESRDGYPALVANLKRLLVELANLRVVDAKTDQPDKYARLGVEGIDKPDSASVQITASDAKNSPLAALIVGKKRESKVKSDSAHYVRKVDQARAYLVKGDLAVSAKPNDWLNAELLNIGVERVRQLTINPYQGMPVMLSKAKRSDSFFTLQNLPKGFEPRARTVVSSLGGILQDVRFETVLAADKNTATVPRVIAELQTWDGLVATIEELDHPDHAYVRFSFAFNPDIVVAAEVAPAAQGTDGKPAEPAAAPAAAPKIDVAAEVAKLNELTKGWIYGLPDYKTRMLEKKMDDLIKPAEKQKPAADGESGKDAAEPSAEGEPPVRMPPTREMQ